MSISISIIIPAYNAQHYIGECLEAILQQIQSSHELIVVDDGSVDATLERVREIQARHSDVHFTVLTQPNGGVSVARNQGLAAARGEYVAFVDCDDVLLPGALAALGEAIALHQSDVVVCDFNMWRPDKESKSRRVSMGYPAARPICDTTVILNTFFSDRQMYVWAHVFRRAVYGRVPAPVFPPGRVYEDVATLPRLLSQCASLVYLPQPIIDYRQHPTSITRVISEQWCIDFTSALALARDYLDEIGIDESVKRHFDIAAAVFYIGVVKNSYQLELATGQQVRARIKHIFLDSLYGDCGAMRAALRSGEVMSRNRKGDLNAIKQVRAALSGSLVFGLRQVASRRLKLWQRQRRAGKAPA